MCRVLLFSLFLALFSPSVFALNSSSREAAWASCRAARAGLVNPAGADCSGNGLSPQVSLKNSNGFLLSYFVYPKPCENSAFSFDDGDKICYPTCTAPTVLNKQTKSCDAPAPPPPHVCYDIHTTLANPLPGTQATCDAHLEQPTSDTCPTDISGICYHKTCLGPNGYEAFVSSSLATCAEPPTDCRAQNPHSHNTDSYTCAPDPPVTCPAGSHNLGSYDCEPDPTTPDPPPTDPNGNGGGNNGNNGNGGDGNNDGTGTGTGTGTDPGTGTGTGGTQEPTQCGSLACDATLQAMSAQLVSILGAVNTTRSNELAGILSAAKTANGNGLSTLIKVGTIAADVFEAVSYLSNIYSKLGQSQIDLSAMRDSLSIVKDLMSQMNGKFDVQKQQLDDLLSKLDQQLGKQEAANGKLDGIKDKLDDLRQKGQDGNDKLDDLRRKHDDTNGKLDDIKGKLDRGNSTWDAILEWLTRLSVLSDILDWLRGFSIDLTPITDLLDAILNKLDFCADHPDWLFCPSELPDVGAVDLDTKPIDADFSAKVSGSGSCPADVPIPLSFGTYSLSFAYICDLADSLYYLVLALSYLAAARILAAPLGVG